MTSAVLGLAEVARRVVHDEDVIVDDVNDGVVSGLECLALRYLHPFDLGSDAPGLAYLDDGVELVPPPCEHTVGSLKNVSLLLLRLSADRPAQIGFRRCRTLRPGFSEHK